MRLCLALVLAIAFWIWARGGSAQALPDPTQEQRITALREAIKARDQIILQYQAEPIVHCDEIDRPIEVVPGGIEWFGRGCTLTTLPEPSVSFLLLTGAAWLGLLSASGSVVPARRV